MPRVGAVWRSVSTSWPNSGSNGPGLIRSPSHTQNGESHALPLMVRDLMRRVLGLNGAWFPKNSGCLVFTDPGIHLAENVNAK